MTRSDGKNLEGFIQQIEKLHLPLGFKVEERVKEIDEEGVSLAEFDLVITGRVGSTDFKWLIECRDRPSKGAAPGEWIEQLATRKNRFSFDKVTAVSTTGFSASAIDCAKQFGIELRSVSKISPENVAEWIRIDHAVMIETIVKLETARFIVSEKETDEDKELLRTFLQKTVPTEKILRSTETNDTFTADSAFASALSSDDSVLSDLVPDGPGKIIRIQAHYPDDASHFVVDVQGKAIRVTEIQFQGMASLRRTSVPLGNLNEYREELADRKISQTASFPFEIHGLKYAIELHNLAETGETHVALRRV